MTDFMTDLMRGKMNIESETSETMLKGIRGGEELAKKRATQNFDYEVAVCLWLGGLNDGEDNYCEFKRPNDFAVTKTWEYHEIEGGNVIDGRKYLCHVYVDKPISREEACLMLASISSALVRGISRFPFAPSDPLREDDLWDRKRLGAPTWFESEEDW